MKSMSDKSVQSTCIEQSNITQSITEGRCSFNPKTDWINIEVNSERKTNQFEKKNISKQINKEKEIMPRKSSVVPKSCYKNKYLFNLLRIPSSDSQNNFKLKNKGEKSDMSRSIIIHDNISNRNIDSNITDKYFKVTDNLF